jgi:nucleotide-binding universal stress UspA family protein
MKKIMIPTDFSETALNALNYAGKLLKNDLCTFYILHAYQQEIYESNTLINEENLAEITKTVQKKAQENLEKLLKQIKAFPKNVKHHYKVISANNILIDEVDNIVDVKDIDIVIMGTNGMTDDKNLTFGSNTVQVLKYIKCPVLIIPKEYRYNAPKKIVFSSNFYIPYRKRELHFLSELALNYQSKIDVLSFSDLNTISLREAKNKHFIEEIFKKNEPSFVIGDGKDIIKTIKSYIADHSIDILVMTNRRHSFLENILFKDTINTIGLSIKIPFLVLQNIKRD